MATSDAFVHDQQTGTTTRVSVGPGGAQGNGQCTIIAPPISADGRWVAFLSAASNLVAGDTNGKRMCSSTTSRPATTARVSVGAATCRGTG